MVSNKKQSLVPCLAAAAEAERFFLDQAALGNLEVPSHLRRCLGLLSGLQGVSDLWGSNPTSSSQNGFQKPYRPLKLPQGR